MKIDWAVRLCLLMHRPEMQENAHGTGLKAGIQLGCLGHNLGRMDGLDGSFGQLGNVG